MNYKQLKRQNKVYKELYTHYKELSEAAISELQFEKLQLDSFKQLVTEVKMLLDQKAKPDLIKKVIENGEERHNLDKMININILFGND